MKTVSAGTITSVMFLLNLISYAEVADLLKPEYQRQEQELRRIMEQLSVKGLKYDIVTEKLDYPHIKHEITSGQFKTVRIPKDIEAKIWQYNQRFAVWNFASYFEDPKHSFNMGVLSIRYAFSRGFVFIPIPKSITKRDKKLWEQEFTPELKGYFIEWSGMGYSPLTKEKVSAFTPREGYYGSILFESIPPDYNRNIFAERVYKVDRVYEPKPIMPSEEEYGKFFDAFLKDGDKSVLKEIALVQPCVEHWLYLALFGEEEKRLLSLEGLLAWSRINSPVENPFLSALAMGLFTVNGYAFNDETGVYTMNERGRMLMDFIVEFPIPENATRLQVVMNGGNKEEIQAMMKKHSTGEKWAELLKNPVHPEFAKYPQD